MQTIQSPTLALLAVPAIQAGGIESSIVFHQLPVSAQAAIRNATDSQTKFQIVVEAGDPLPVMAEMYEHYVAAPARRSQAGLAFPACESLDGFFCPVFCAKPIACGFARGKPSAPLRFCRRTVAGVFRCCTRTARCVAPISTACPAPRQSWRRSANKGCSKQSAFLG